MTVTLSSDHGLEATEDIPPPIGEVEQEVLYSDADSPDGSVAANPETDSLEQFCYKFLGLVLRSTMEINKDRSALTPESLRQWQLDIESGAGMLC